MKRACLLLSTVLLLSSCAAPNDSVETTGTQNGENATDLEEMSGKYGVDTDYSGLTDYNADWEVKSHYFDGPLDEFIPDAGYGTILPYLGEILYGADGGIILERYGLCTGDGEIITKPIYENVQELYNTLNYGNYPSSNISNGMLLLTKQPEEGLKKCAVAAADGSWISDFAYDYIYCRDGYAMACNNGSEAIPVIIAPDGSEVFSSEIVEYVFDVSEDYCLILRNDGSGYDYINTSGEQVLGSFDDTTGFNEGIAGVCDGDNWRYIDKSGKTVLNMGVGYENCGIFIDGYASIRYVDGSGAMIDKDGNILYDKELHYEINGIWYNDAADYTRCYYDGAAGFEQITYQGSADIQYTGFDKYFYKSVDGGVMLFESGDDAGVYIEGSGLILSKDSEDALGVFSTRDEKPYYGVIDTDGNYLIEPFEAYGQFIHVEGERTIIHLNGMNLKTSDGRVILKNCVSASSFEGTDYIMVRDKISAGYITIDGEWILRVSLLDSLPD